MSYKTIVFHEKIRVLKYTIFYLSIRVYKRTNLCDKNYLLVISIHACDINIEVNLDFYAIYILLYDIHSHENKKYVSRNKFETIKKLTH